MHFILAIVSGKYKTKTKCGPSVYAFSIPDFSIVSAKGPPIAFFPDDTQFHRLVWQYQQFLAETDLPDIEFETP